MKILFIYPNAEGYGRIPIGMSVIMTILKKRGHQIDLFDTTFILNNGNIDNSIREKAKFVLPTDISHLYDYHSPEEVDELLKERMKSFDPDLVAVSIVEDNYQYADDLLGVVKSVKRNVPVIVGGSTPTVVPEIIIENPNIDYVIQGEGEEPLAEFCDLIERGKSIEGVNNIWFKKNGTVRFNIPRPFIDLDTLPIQDLSLWNRNHFVKPYDGKLCLTGNIEMSRGCLHKCSYCINYSCQTTFGNERNKFHREKSIENVIREIKTLMKLCNLEMVFFCDDDFLLMSRSRLEEFQESWKKEINLPYWINTTVETVNRERLKYLKETGCCGIGIGIETGCEWLRKRVLLRNTSNKQIKEGFQLIHEYGIRTTANIMLGFPGEYEEDIFETIKLVKQVKPKSCSLSFVAPYIGTAIHAVSKKLDYIETWDKPGFKGMVKNTSMRKGSTIRLPQISNEKLIDSFYKLTDYINGQLQIPKKFENPAPGSNPNASPRKDMGIEIVQTMKSLGFA